MSIAPQLSTVIKALKIGILVAVLVAICSTFIPNRYQSTATILPSETTATSGLGQIAATAAAFGIGVPGADSRDSNFIEILGSRSLRQDLLKAEYDFPARSWRFGKEERRHQSLYNYLKAKNVDDGIAQLSKIYSVNQNLKTKVIYVSAETNSPILSMQIVDNAVKYLEFFVMTKSRTKSGNKAKFSAARLIDSKQEMKVSEESFRDFLEANRNYQTSGDPVVRLKGARLEADLKMRQQMVLTIAMGHEQAMLDEKNDIPVVNVLDPANTPVQKSWPSRGFMVLLSLLASIGVTWLFLNREWVIRRLIEDEPTC